MGEQVIQKAFTVSDSVYLVLLIGLALGTWWIIKWILANQKEIMARNDEREKRYIGVIEAQAKGLQNLDEMRKDVKEIKDQVFGRRG